MTVDDETFYQFRHEPSNNLYTVCNFENVQLGTNGPEMAFSTFWDGIPGLQGPDDEVEIADEGPANDGLGELQSGNAHSFLQQKEPNKLIQQLEKLLLKLIG